MGLKVIWRMEEGCGEVCGNPGFNSTWLDLFSEPKLRLADNFPGELMPYHFDSQKLGLNQVCRTSLSHRVYSCKREMLQQYEDQ